MAAQADRLRVARHHVVAAGVAVGNDAVVAGRGTVSRLVGAGRGRRAGTLRQRLRAAGDGVVAVAGFNGVVAGPGAGVLRRVVGGGVGRAGLADRLRVAGHQVLALIGSDVVVAGKATGRSRVGLRGDGSRLRPRLGTAGDGVVAPVGRDIRSEEHTSELQSLMRISYAVFC